MHAWFASRYTGKCLKCCCHFVMYLCRYIICTCLHHFNGHFPGSRQSYCNNREAYFLAHPVWLTFWPTPYNHADSQHKTAQICGTCSVEGIIGSGTISWMVGKSKVWYSATSYNQSTETSKRFRRHNCRLCQDSGSAHQLIDCIIMNYITLWFSSLPVVMVYHLPVFYCVCVCVFFPVPIVGW